MARHTDATGYLIELRNSDSTPWFSIVCDYAVSAQNATLSEDQINQITEVFLGNETYQPQTATPTAPPPPAAGAVVQPAPTTVPFLEKLSQFVNFKQLSNTLELNIDKRITIIFGKNASGKSSLCDAIKVLASPQAPEKPLHNVKSTDTNPTSFNYKFNIDSGESTWQIPDGYGALSDRIKYFDSTIAYNSLRDPASPESVVSIEPFRLEVFQYAGAFVRLLNQALDAKFKKTQTETIQILQNIKTVFLDFIDHEAMIAELDLTSSAELKQQLESHTPLDDNEIEIHQKLKAQLKRLNAATSEAGLRLQKTEFYILLQFSRSVKSFKRLYSGSSLRGTADLSQSLTDLNAHQSELAKSITPHDVDKTDFISFIQASQPLIDYETITEEDKCPFCQRPFDQESLDLCELYHEFLLDKVGKDISEVEGKLRTANRNIQAVKNFTLSKLDSSSFPAIQATFDDIGDWVANIQACIPDPGVEIDASKYETSEDNEVRMDSITQLAKEVLLRYRAMKIATGDSERLQKEINTLSETIRKYDYRVLFETKKEALDQLAKKIDGLNDLKTKINGASFSGRLRNITNKHKETYRELVVTDFEKALNDEYINLSEKDMNDYGIKLHDSGAAQRVELNANIGDVEIHRVLSEGEQKIHALALFYAEACAGDQAIIVFDDPVTSFDYDYSERYALRLRDFAIQYPARQIIVLTHNWDFFVHIQIIFNKARLNNYLSIQVIDHCSIVNEYREDIDELKSIITPKLVDAGAMSLEDKVVTSVFIRRLIESIVNKYVFNNQRYQFKQKSMNVSDFHAFRKLVPLEETEAIGLVDIYGRLSVPEHSDERNHYRNIDRNDFSTLYAKVCKIEGALKLRRSRLS